VSCPHAVNTAALNVNGRRAAVIRCPQGSSQDSGHVVLEWHEGRISYGVSAHGLTDVNRRLVMLIALSLKRAT
jgi:hypothetical protein